MQKVFIETLGCKINQYESACIYDDFSLRGYQIADSMNIADVIIINTCTVTNRTDYKSRNLINKAKALKQGNNEVRVIVTGCYSQRHREEILADGYVDLIVDNNQKNKIFEYLAQDQKKKLGCLLSPTLQSIAIPEFAEVDTFEDFSEMSMSMQNERSRAFLKIQDGCDFYCSYCAVPFARGKPRSRSLESILKQVELFLSHGYEELVLGGINLGLYSSKGMDLAELLYRLCEYDNLRRIRLSSLEPQLFTDKLFRAIEEIDKICPHFHIPLQTGCDELLKLHHRRYTVREFVRVANTLHQIKPFAAIGFDVIAGLPFESDDFFAETYNLLKKTEFAYLHVFVYSKRKGTFAATMKGQINGAVAKQRSNMLLKMGIEKKHDFVQKLIDNNVCLSATEEGSDEKKNVWFGTSDRYVKVYVGLDGKAKDMPPLYPRSPLLANEGRLLPQVHFDDGVFCEVIK